MHGWMGQRLRINLTNKTYKVEELTADYCKKWLGGRGFNSDVVYHETKQGMSPFSPDNPLCFAPGSLTGTLAPTSGKTVVSARSPMTCSTMGTDIHGHGDTNMGGSFGPKLKYAGYDQLIVKGIADKPVFLFIDDDKIEFRDASHLWGKETKTATKMIVNEIGDPDIGVTIIGPAGENLVRFACIIDTFSSAEGRAGMGAVMGSKNLKAIAVKGTNPITIAQPKEFKKTTWALRRKMHTSKEAIQLRELGSLKLFDNGNDIGLSAHKNCSTGYMEKMEETYSSNKWNEDFLFRRRACWSCPVACGRYTYIKDGKYKDFHCSGPEMESLCNLGPRIDSIDVSAVTVMCGMANELGMDSISAGAALSWTMEAFEKGYLTEKDTGGLKLDWGDVETSMKVLKMISAREGFGDILAEGTIRAAEKMNTGMDIVSHCRGLDHISADPRIALEFGLGYAMSTRGSEHLNFTKLPEEPLKDKEKLHTMNTKPELCTWYETNQCLADLVGCCCNPLDSLKTTKTSKSSVDAYIPMLNAATGIEISYEESMTVAKRVISIERAHWLREGSGKQDDTHIKRYFDEPVSDGPHKGLHLDKKEWKWAQQKYYKLHGWDDAGFITPSKAKHLDIKEIIPDMDNGKRIFTKWTNKN